MKSTYTIRLLLALCLWPQFLNAQTPVAEGALTTNQIILARNGKSNARVHDPSTIVKYKDDYWVFFTGQGVGSWHSKDLLQWVAGPRVFAQEQVPTWITNVVARQRGDFWAPDVILHNGKYYLYYSISAFGQNTSAIALVTNPSLDPAEPNYKWNDEGIVIQSYRTNNYNAIDPAIFRAEDKTLWLTFGSFWNGIKLIQLDPETGKRLNSETPPLSLARNKVVPPDEIEAPYIYQHDGYYYLFVSWDRCCRGVNSTYNTRVGRSKEVTGPYLDKEGVDLANGGGTMFLETDGPFIGPGHAGIYEEKGKFWFSCHFYDGTTQRGTSTLAVRPMHWAADGWPVLDQAAVPVVN